MNCGAGASGSGPAPPRSRVERGRGGLGRVAGCGDACRLTTCLCMSVTDVLRAMRFSRGPACLRAGSRCGHGNEYALEGSEVDAEEQGQLHDRFVAMLELLTPPMNTSSFLCRECLLSFFFRQGESTHHTALAPDPLLHLGSLLSLWSSYLSAEATSGEVLAVSMPVCGLCESVGSDLCKDKCTRTSAHTPSCPWGIPASHKHPVYCRHMYSDTTCYATT